MAVVTGPLHSSEARGKVGALQYNTYRGRAIVKTNSGPAIEDQYTEARVALRVLTHNATSDWQSMTDAQRALWHKYAVEHLDPDWTGQPKRLTGYNWFIRINVRRQLLGSAISSTPPTSTVLCVCAAPHISVIETVVYIAWTAEGEYTVGQTMVEAWITDAHSAGANPTRKAAKRDGVATFPSQLYEFVRAENLWYTAFIRPINLSGVAGSWTSTKFQYPVT